MTSHLRFALLAFAACSACTNSAPTTTPAAPGLIPVLACPSTVAAGAPFDVDGSGTLGDVIEHHLKLSPGDDEVDALTTSFTAAAPGIVTVTLTVADDHGANASAACRVVVTGAAIGEGEGEGAGEGEGEGDVVGAEGEGEGEGDVNDGEPVQLSGAFALVSYDAPTLHSLAFDPQDQCTASPSLSLVTIAQHDDTHVDLTVQLCHITLPSVQLFALGLQESDAPDDIVDALPSLHSGFEVLGGVRVGAELRPPLAQLGHSVVAGAILASDDEALPTSGDDPRVSDDDNDGAAGVTVHSTLGDQLTVLRRTIRAFHGIIESGDAVDGSAEGSFRLDGDASLLSLPFASFVMPAGQGRPSTFRLTRADGGDHDYRGTDGAVTCDDLRGHYAELLATVAPPVAPSTCAVLDAP